MVGKHHRIAGLKRVALSSAVTAPRPDVAQIAALADRLPAVRTEIFSKRHPAIDQHESHLAPPGAKQLRSAWSCRCSCQVASCANG